MRVARAPAFLATIPALLGLAAACTELPTADSEPIPLNLRFTALPEFYLGDTVEVVVEASTLDGAVLTDPPIHWFAEPTFGEPDGIWGWPVVVAGDSGRISLAIRRVGEFRLGAKVAAASGFLGDTLIADRPMRRFLSSFELVGVDADTTLFTTAYEVDVPIHAADQYGRPTTDLDTRVSIRGDSAVTAAAGAGFMRIRTVADGTDTLIVWQAECDGACADTLVVTVDRVPAEIRFSAWVRLRSLGDTARLTATVHDSSGTRLHDELVTWSAADPADSTILDLVDADSGRVVAVGNGVARFVARSGDLVDTTDAWVEQAVDSFAVTMPADTLVVGASDTATVGAVWDARGHPVPSAWVQPPEWRWYDLVVSVVVDGFQAVVTGEAVGGTYFDVRVRTCGPYLACQSAMRDHYIWVVEP